MKGKKWPKTIPSLKYNNQIAKDHLIYRTRKNRITLHNWIILSGFGYSIFIQNCPCFKENKGQEK